MLINQHLIFIFFILALVLKTCLAQRRIVDGTKVHNEVRFMAYLVKSEHSARAYHGWQCGGAIISPLHILTAAACVIDVDHLYAVVGYNKYVSADALEDDPCTRNRKKKVVKTCAPKAYNVQLTGWTNHDIGIAILESSLDFTDATYKIDCSYPPAPIQVNFDPQYERPDTDVVAMGWGHSARLRRPHHLQDHNEPFLQEASLLIVERDICVKKFDFDPAVERVIENDIICVEGQGNLNAEGQELDHGPLHYKCEDENDLTTAAADVSDSSTSNSSLRTTTTNITTDDTTIHITDSWTSNSSLRTTTTNITTDDTTIHITDSWTSNSSLRTTTTNISTTTPSPEIPLLRENVQNKFIDYYEDDELYDDLLKRRDTKGRWRRFNACRRRMDTRRRGLCQNDHGGPLITWMGVKPIVIGVASTNLYNKSYACISPNIFTSTMSNKWFIKCAVKDSLDDLESRRTCSQMLQREGSRTYEEVSNWVPGAHQKAPMINPHLIPVLSLQMALSTYLKQYQNVQSNVPSIDTLRQKNIPHNQLLQNRALSNYEKHLLLRQSNKDQKIPNLVQNVFQSLNKLSNYQQELPNNQQIARYNPAIVTEHQQSAATGPYIETDNQQNASDYQQNIPHYQHNAPVMATKHQQNIPTRQSATTSQFVETDYQQNIPHYQQNAPYYQHHPVMGTKHQQNIPTLQSSTTSQYVEMNYQQNVPDYQQNAPNNQHHPAMVTKHQQNLPTQQSSTTSQYVEMNYQQNVPDYQQNAPNNQHHPVMVTKHQQNLPTRQSSTTSQYVEMNYQQNVPDYQQNAPNNQHHPVMVTKHQQNLPTRQSSTISQFIETGYQQNTPDYQQNTPRYQQNAPHYPQGIHYEQNKPLYDQTVMKTRPLKNINEASTPRSYNSKLSTLRDNLVRRKTISWRRHILGTSYADSWGYENEEKATVADDAKPTAQEFVINLNEYIFHTH